MCYNVYGALRVTNGGSESITLLSECVLPEAGKGCFLFLYMVHIYKRHKAPESLGRNMLDKCFSLENVYSSDMIPFMFCVWECIHFSKTDTLGNIFLESAWNFWPKWPSIVGWSFLGWLGDCRSGLGAEAGKTGN